MKIHDVISKQSRGFQIYGKTRNGTKKYWYAGLISSGFGLHKFVDEYGNKYFVTVNSYNDSLMTINPWDDHLLCIGDDILFKLKLNDKLKIFICNLLGWLK